MFGRRAELRGTGVRGLSFPMPVPLRPDQSHREPQSIPPDYYDWIPSATGARLPGSFFRLDGEVETEERGR